MSADCINSVLISLNYNCNLIQLLQKKDVSSVLGFHANGTFQRETDMVRLKPAISQCASCHHVTRPRIHQSTFLLRRQ